MALMLFASFLYVSEEIHTYIAILLILFAYIVLSASYRMYQSLSQAIVLKEMVEASQVELEAVNRSLESRIEKAVQKGRDQELKLLQQSRLAQMGEMISMIAHQWRQPLSAISATAMTLNIKVTMDKYDKEFFYQNISKISEFSQYLSSTIDDFRSFFKSNKNKEHFYMRQVVEGSLAIINISLQNKGIEVISQYESSVQVFSYFNELKQVCLNLLKNAEDILLQKNIQTPKIWVHTYNTDKHLFLQICDNGGGIDEAILHKIFDPYFTTKEQYDGTGLGLYMSRTIVEEHCGGKLSVKNSNQGAVFTIALPLEQTVH
jgi:signal transduction histidine kinase